MSTKQKFAGCFLGLALLTLSHVRAESRPTFTTVSCPADIRATECGFVAVLENRAKLDREIKLFVAVTRSANKTANDPIIFLAGGPGQFGAVYAALGPLFPERDFIAFDQRGVGRSEPALACSELDKFASNHWC